MRPLVIVLGVLALGVATLTTVLFSHLISHQAESAAVAAPAPPPVELPEIAVAARDIKPGAIVNADDIRYALWPAQALDPRYVRREKGNELIGTIARRPLLANEPMTADAVFRKGETGVMAGVLSPGMRAVSIGVTAITGVAGFVLPNDHVDILLNQDVHTVTGPAPVRSGRGDLLRFATETILSDIRVLAVDDKLAKPDGAANQTGKSVTLEVSAKDAEALVVAERMGELVLALRSMTPGPAPAAVGYVGDVAASQALRAIQHPHNSGPLPSGGTVHVDRGGVITQQQFVF